MTIVTRLSLNARAKAQQQRRVASRRIASHRRGSPHQLSCWRRCRSRAACTRGTPTSSIMRRLLPLALSVACARDLRTRQLSGCAARGPPGAGACATADGPDPRSTLRTRGCAEFVVPLERRGGRGRLRADVGRSAASASLSGRRDVCPERERDRAARGHGGGDRRLAAPNLRFLDLSANARASERSSA